jgi:phosphoribosylanthranilate isomerase
MRVEAKVCGLRRGEDAAVAVRAGATYLGVVYAGGPRQVSDVQAAEVVAASDGVPVLAVWGRADRDAILRVRDVAHIAGVQLHGGSEPALAESLRQEGLIVWRVVRLDGPAALSQIEGAMVGADGLLVEPKVAGREGGAGVALDPELGLAARTAFDAAKATRTPHLASLAAARGMPRTRFVLAGGLTPDTVRTTIRSVRPDIVDVSSGVESSPGVKDPVRIRRFLAEALADHPSP